MNKSIIFVGIIGLFILSAVVPIGMGYNIRATIEQQPTGFGDGNTLYVGGTGPNNYTTIQSAIDDAVDGDTVFVFGYSSPYKENIYVDKSINLIGENKEFTLIESDDDWPFIIHIWEDRVNISGFTIRTNSNEVITHVSISPELVIWIDRVVNNGGGSFLS